MLVRTYYWQREVFLSETHLRDNTIISSIPEKFMLMVQDPVILATKPWKMEAAVLASHYVHFWNHGEKQLCLHARFRRVDGKARVFQPANSRRGIELYFRAKANIRQHLDRQ